MDPRAWRRFRKNKGALAGAVLVALVTLTAILGPILAPHDPNEQQRETLINDEFEPAAPFEVEGHWLGADSTGRDELSRLLWGGGISMMVAYLATALAIFIGMVAGITSGYFGGWIDFGWMRLVDLLLSLPFLLIAIAIQGVVEDPSLFFLILLLALLSWTRLARVTRSKVLQVRELEYIQAALALGMSHTRVLLRHVLPNVLGPIIVLGTTLVARMIIFESALSFLGLGVDPPDASWGSMLNEGRQQLAYPRLMLFPATLIVMTVFGFNLLGDGLRDAFDPKD
ncbi:MAG: ABC transporter permease [Myxococcota bacterium]